MQKLLLIHGKRLKTNKLSSLNKNLNLWPKPSGKKGLFRKEKSVC